MLLTGTAQRAKRNAANNYGRKETDSLQFLFGIRD